MITQSGHRVYLMQVVLLHVLRIQPKQLNIEQMATSKTIGIVYLSLKLETDCPTQTQSRIITIANAKNPRPAVISGMKYGISASDRYPPPIPAIVPANKIHVVRIKETFDPTVAIALGCSPHARILNPCCV